MGKLTIGVLGTSPSLVFKHFPIQKHMDAKFALLQSRPRSTEDHFLNKLCRTRVPDAVNQVWRSLACWFQRRCLKGFNIYGHGGNLDQWPGSFEQLSFPHPIEVPYEIWLARRFLRRRCSKSVDDGRTDVGACLYFKLTL